MSIKDEIKALRRIDPVTDATLAHDRICDILDAFAPAAPEPGEKVTNLRTTPRCGICYDSYDVRWIGSKLVCRTCVPDTQPEVLIPAPAAEDALSFAELRAANRRRLPQFRNKRGELCHTADDGSDWPLSKWANAVCGELGEAANLIKKIERGDFTLAEAREDLGRELADVVTYLDILACAAGVDLGAATVGKFNEVSERVGSDAILSRPAKEASR